MSIAGNILDIGTLIATDFQTSNQWQFEFFDQDSGSLFPLQSLRTRIQTCTLPFFSFDIDESHTGLQSYVNYRDIKEFSITFWETSRFQIYDYLIKWRDEIYDIENRVFFNGNHTKNGQMTFEDGAIAIKQIDFKNILLKSITDYNLDYTSGDPLSVTASFSVELVIEKKGNRLASSLL